jgi:hypothetical protein
MRVLPDIGDRIDAFTLRKSPTVRTQLAAW